VSSGRRLFVLVFVVAVIAAGVVTDHLVHRTAAAAAQTLEPRLPSLAPASALSSTWFCPATSSVANGLADGLVVIANPADVPLTGTATLFPSGGTSRTVAVQVAAQSRISLRPGNYVKSSYTATVVQLDGPTGAVEQQIRGSLGESTSPCATSASDHWYFAAGSTDRTDQMLLSLFNPFPGDAVVDLDFSTDIGPARPADLQGLVVPGQGVVVVNIGDHVRRRQVISTSVSVRSGRIVVDRIQIRAPASPVAPAPTSTSARATNRAGPASAPSTPIGVTLTLGVPAPGRYWVFPDGVTAPGVDERYEFYNPGDGEAHVSLTLVLDRGSADPFDLTVPAHARLTLVVNGESRIPPGIAHAGVVQSSNGVGVVVERVISAGPPSSHLGISDLTGSPVASPHWVFAAGAANKVQDEWLVAYNPGHTPAHLSVMAYVSGQPLVVDGLQGVEIQPGERVPMRLGDHLSQGNLMLVVDAEAPIVVERDLYRLSGIGMSASLGIPSAG